MKTSSKLYFALGALASLGTMALVYSAIQDTDKSPKELLEDSKNFIKSTVKKGDQLMDKTVGSFEKESKSILKEASNVI
jgi:hypothetical protein